jgi:hypothetical protein
MAELKYLTIWKDGRLIFLKRRDFERRGIWRKLVRRMKRFFIR